jgi:hypothetical protein
MKTFHLHCEKTTKMTDQPAAFQSHPIDPQSPSLLTVPGEVRNAILEALFELNRPIVISPSDGTSNSSSDYQSSDIRGVALLRTCRQIHQEATGILYNRNIFCLAEEHYGTPGSTIQWGMDWLQDIGKHSSYVRHVQIHDDSIRYDSESINILPILRRVWQPEHAALKVEIIPTSPLTESQTRYGPTSDASAEKNAAECNKQLMTIINDPSESIKRYHAIPHLLQDVWLDHDRNVVWTANYIARGGVDCPLSGNDFEIPHEVGEPLIKVPLEGLRTIMGYKQLRWRILDMALFPKNHGTFDVTNSETSVDRPNMDLMKRVLCGKSRLYEWFLSGVVDVKLTSQHAKATFAEEVETMRTEWHHDSSDDIHIYLRYELDHDSSLDDVQFDAFGLVCATMGCRATTRVHLEITNSQPSGGTTPSHTHTLSLKNIRQRVNLLVYEILKYRPAYDMSHQPSIWMNGRGEVLRAEWDASGCSNVPLVNKDGAVSQEVVKARWNEISAEWKDLVERGRDEKEYLLATYMDSGRARLWPWVQWAGYYRCG